jgi:hypothetical protein
MNALESLSLHFALHGAIVLFAGLVGGLFFASAIKRSRGEVAWRVVHSGGCMAGTMLLAIAWPIRFVVLPAAVSLTLAWALIGGTYVLVLGMFLAAATGERGIPGGGSGTNRVVATLYAVGTTASLLGGALLVLGLAGALW